MIHLRTPGRGFDASDHPSFTGSKSLRRRNPSGHNHPAADVPHFGSWDDGGVAESSKEKWANPEPPIHKAIARWAAMCAERALPVFEERRPDDVRPRAAIESLRAWERGEIPMTACRTAAVTPDAVAAARAAGQAAAVAHMFDHAPHAAAYAARAVGLHGAGKADRKAERTWQWENLDPELRTIGFPKGL